MSRVVKNQLFGDKIVNLVLISKQKLFNFLLQSYILPHTILLFNSDVLKNFQSKYKCPVGIQESKKVVNSVNMCCKRRLREAVLRINPTAKITTLTALSQQ